MKSFSWSTFAGASLGVLAFALGAPGSVSAQYGSSGGSSGGSSHGSLFKGHGSSGGSSHGSLFAGHGSSGGGKHASLFSHGSSGGSSGGSKHASLFSHGSSGGSSGGSKHASLFSHGSSGGSSGGSSHGSLFKGHGSSGGSSGGSYGSAGGIFMGSNVATPSAGDTMLTSTSFVAPVAPVNAGVAYLNVNVPADAKVYLQDQLMTVAGTQRRFVTPQMENGVQHVYTVKVEVVRNGQTIAKTAQAAVAAGQEIGVSVAFDAQIQQESVATTGL